MVGISNVFAVEAWNSYANPFPRDLELRVTHEVSINLTNENGVLRATNMTIGQTMPAVIPDDWPLASFFVSMLNTNNPLKLLSINETKAAEWSRVLNGIQVLTNTLTDAELNTALPPPQGFDSLVMQSNSPQAMIIADAIGSTRFNQPNQHFRDLGDILATPELSVASMAKSE